MTITKLIGLTITGINVQKGVDDGTGFVYLDAVGADETPDIDGEIFDYSSSKPFVEAWSVDAESTTKAAGQIVSYGNVRAQHGAAGAQNAAGSLCEPIEFNDSERRISLSVKVVDKDACMKVAEGIYRGMSIKGALVGKKWKDGKFWRYTVNPTEFSLVDKPANPNATFTIVKADGSTEVHEPEESLISKAATILQEMSPVEVKELIVMAEEIKKAAAIEKMKAARKAHDENSSCIGGWCDHGDAKKCAEKVAENHKKVMTAFEDDDEDDAEKAAKDAEIAKAAADKAAADQKAAEEAQVDEKEKAAIIEKAAASTNPEVAELAKLVKAQDEKITELTAEVAKAAEVKAAGRPVPMINGAVVKSKTDENGGTEKDLVEKRAEVKADDPNRISKLAAIDRASEPELVKI